MDQLIYASLSHTHYWYEVGMMKVPAFFTPDLVGTEKTSEINLYVCGYCNTDSRLGTAGVRNASGWCYGHIVWGHIAKKILS